MKSQPEVSSRLTPARAVALVAGCLLLLPGIGLLLGGGALGVAYAFDRDDSGYFSTDLQTLRSPTPAVTVEDLVLPTDLRSPDWLLETLRTDVRLRVTPVEGDRPAFVGIDRASDVGSYLAGVRHDEIIGVERTDTPIYRTRAGSSAVGPPTGRPDVPHFWRGISR